MAVTRGQTMFVVREAFCGCAGDIARAGLGLAAHVFPWN